MPWTILRIRSMARPEYIDVVGTSRALDGISLLLSARRFVGRTVSSTAGCSATSCSCTSRNYFRGRRGQWPFPHQPLTTLDAVSNYLERRIQVLCAGVCAEYPRDGVVDEDQALNAMRNGGAVNDWSKVTENIRTLFGIRFS
jgi:hypothetical protein